MTMETMNVLGLTVFPYGLAVAASAAVALALAGLTAGKRGVSGETVSWFAVLAVPLGLLMARLGYCLAAFDWVSQEGIGFFFRFTSGGYLLYGAMLGCVLAAVAAAGITGTPVLRLTDALAAPGAVMILLCRLAEGLVGEGYGWGVEDWFMEDGGMSLFVLEDTSLFQRFPFAIQDMYDGWNWAVFVLEAMMAAAIAVAVLRAGKTRMGGRTVLFLTLYAACQVLGESLRQDAVLRFGFVRVNQLLCAVLLAAMLVVCLARAGERRPGPIAGLTVLLAAGMGLVIAMEFALEKKISAIEWVPMDVCYAVMTVGCAMMAAAVLLPWKRAFGEKHS